MKVVQINATYGIGSTGRLCRDIHLYMLEHSKDSYVFTPLISKKYNEEVSVIKIGNKFDHICHAVLRRIFKNQGFNSIIATEIMCKKIKQINPDIVHLHNLHSNFINIAILLSFLKKYKIPTLVTLHDTWTYTGNCTHYLDNNCEQWKNGSCSRCPAEKKIYWTIIRNQYSLKKALFEKIPILFVNGVSKWTTDSAGESFLRCAKSISHIYNWITPQYDGLMSREQVFSIFNLDKSKKLIIGVAQSWNNAQAKGFPEFCKLSDALFDIAEILLIGQYDDKSTIKGMTFAGYIRDEILLNSIYSVADVFVNPSRRETFGLTTVEAMSHGTPVVAYDNTGSSELVLDTCGILVEDGNFELLKNAVNKVLIDGRSKYSEFCKKRYLDYFQKEMQLEKYYKLYNDMFCLRNKTDE